MAMTRLVTLIVAAVSTTVVCGEVPAKMRGAAVMSRSWDFQFHLDKVSVIDFDVPQPGKGEVLVEVHASNINPVDYKIVSMAGLLWSYPHKLGSDLSGVVVAVGPGCKRLKVGDEVWGEATTILEAIHTGGTYAQYAAVSESILGVKPKSLNMLEAGAFPMVSLTGYESLTWAAGGAQFKQTNATVLVLGGSGGTGHMGIQLAKAMGAGYVITTCSGAHFDFVKGLGADMAIDYHVHQYYEVLGNKSVDVIYDCVGLKGTGDHAYPILKKGGHFITLLTTGAASISTKLSRPDISSYEPLCIGGCSQYGNIDKISELVEAGKLKVHIDVTYDLEHIVDAYNHSLGGHTTGKVAVQVKKTNQTAAVVPSIVV